MNYAGDFTVSQGKDATTNFLKNKKGNTVAIVLLYDHSEDLTSTLALIVHEAVHIWQEIKQILGEHDPSKEFEAYSIQAISQELMTEYLRQTRRKF